MNFYAASLAAIRKVDGEITFDHFPSFYICRNKSEAQASAARDNHLIHPDKDLWHSYSEEVILIESDVIFSRIVHVLH